MLGSSGYWSGSCPVTSELLGQLRERGYDGRVVPIGRLRSLQEEIEGLREQGAFDTEFYQERIAGFPFRPPESLPEAQSLVIVAVPEPQRRITFVRDGSPVTVIVPPTFYPVQQINHQVQAFLARILGAEEYRIAEVVVPKKLLAVHSGLGVYGRNNLCYVPGMGSFHRLVAFCSDLPCPEDGWQELRMMERCEKCRACVRHCPSGAITLERFLVRAERCLTFHNERLSDVAFPAWVNPAWHDCLVGCMHCQRACPENKAFLGWIEEGVAFSEEETALLLEGIAIDRLPTETVAKLECFDIVDLLEVLPRNLSVLLPEAKACAYII
jgi:epoxyqueuosine reductase